MRRFALVKFDLVVGFTPFYKLSVDGICPIDEFWREIEQQGNLTKQLLKALAIMEGVANRLRLPQNKFKMVKRRGDEVNLFEVKTSDLRIYMFRGSAGMIVVIGGKKSTQDKDIEYFRKLVISFNQTLKK